MLRLGEAVLALAPLGAAILLWAIAVRRLPNRRVIAALMLGLACVAGLLVWQGLDGTLSPHQRYVPAALQNGQVVEGHGG